jgi:hypothetical protein
MFGRSEHVHHHGLLAGIGMGAAAVLSCLVLVLIDWHRAAGPVTMAITAFACFVVAALAAVVLGVVAYAALWLRHKHRQFAAISPPVLQAQVLPAIAAQALPVPGAAAPPALQPAHTHVHLPEGMSPEAVAAALRALAPHPLAVLPEAVEAVLPELERGERP